MYVKYKVDPDAFIDDGSEALKSISIVNLFGEINEQLASDVCSAITACIGKNQGLVPVLIDTYGGEVYSAFKIIDQIKACPIPVMTVCMGKAMSAGTDILVAGTPGYRFTSPNSSIMIHEHSEEWTKAKLTDAKAEVEEANRVSERSFLLLDKHCNQPEGFFQERLKSKDRTDWYLSPSEALELGLVDHIGIPTVTVELTTKIAVNYHNINHKGTKSNG